MVSSLFKGCFRDPSRLCNCHFYNPALVLKFVEVVQGPHTSEETGIGSFTSTLEGLSPRTIYYVRAYAVSDFGLAYGNELVFIATDEAPAGAINGKFTINNNAEQVYFSQGNLQYIGSATTPYWKFAEHQWDCLGTTTGQNSNSQTVDRDLFGWGTSGWNCGNNCYQPWETYNAAGASYGPAGSCNLTGTNANADWGVYNAISNGGNQPNLWRTLSKDEWGYVFDTRTTDSGIRFAKANVNNVNGVIILPDDWNTNYYSLNSTNTGGANYSSNMITAEQWTTLEQYGAVFLPAAFYSDGGYVYTTDSIGYYWSASRGAFRVSFSYMSLSTGGTGACSTGRSVRLVRDAENSRTR
jgi:hypothetical protein